MKVFCVKLLRKMIFALFTGLIFAGVLLAGAGLYPEKAQAATCERIGQCVDDKKCVCSVPGLSSCPSGMLKLSDIDCGSAIIGGITPPNAVVGVTADSGSEIGLVFFASKLITFANIIAGILVMINFVSAGFLYISGAGNAGNMVKINEKLLYSLLGILIIVASYGLAAIFGTIFYGDPTFIISPQLTGALDLEK